MIAAEFVSYDGLASTIVDQIGEPEYGWNDAGHATPFCGVPAAGAAVAVADAVADAVGDDVGDGLAFARWLASALMVAGSAPPPPPPHALTALARRIKGNNKRRAAENIPSHS